MKTFGSAWLSFHSVSTGEEDTVLDIFVYEWVDVWGIVV